MKYFDDIRVGDVVMTGSHTFKADEIKSFARRFDPQLFHMDEAAAAQSHFGALCASGWHTAAAWMRVMIDQQRALEDAMSARGETIPMRGPALGLRDLKWLRPVYVGETITYKSEVTELRVSNSRPEFGLMTILTTGVNQDGAAVISFVSTTFAERRSIS
ncbi:MaoC family dehydratase [Undibacter mobilis]|uniref:Dehydratase n=1 Tax=Undibacter mobilis TaxID=2292256 RepID=A0A371BB16_9BRAD|nr:MaoC family dehydratase [Undibacter mobilis]RDV04815.1 dehydratase [Undibacter mobilis]